MWPFRGNRKPPQRRGEPRRNAAGAPAWWRRFRQTGGLGSSLVAAGLLAAVLVMDLVPLEPLPYRRGGFLDRDVYPRVPFPVESPARTEEARKAAARNTPAVIALDEGVLERIVGECRALPDKLKAATQPAALPAALREDFDLTRPQDLSGFAAYADPPKAPEYAAMIERLGERLLKPHLLTAGDYARATEGRQTRQVRLVGGKNEGVRSTADLVSLADAGQVQALATSGASVFPAGLREKVRHYLLKTFQAGAAIYRFDAEGTEAAEQAARDAVAPATETRPAWVPLARRTSERGLRDADLALLAGEHAAFLHQENLSHPWRRAWIALGRGVMIAALLALLCLYVWKYQPLLVANHSRAVAVAALVGLMLLLTKVMIAEGRWNPYLAVFAVFAAASILAIAFDQRFAFAVGGCLVVLTVLQLRLGMAELLVLWSVAAVAVFLLREVRTRSKLIEAGGVAAATVLGGAWAVEAALGVPVRFTLVDASYAAGAAIAGGFLVQGVLPLVERIFRVATSLTLLEWCDANKPLLKRLALEAPGTYSHSLLLGTICEAAGEAIGANGLLARVGAYYHDVGKINKPDYFVENQPGPASRHDRLSPAMSLLIIKGHVKDGLEMAKEYGLPRVLHEFIAAHHGTTLVEYFYHAAAQQRKAEDERAPEEVEFRYPGPKPRLKESAILMLADACESAVRAMPESTPGRIETQVHLVVTKRLMDGQLDDCEMTLKEVHEIEGSLVKSLCGIHHGRVRYPSQEKPTPAEEAPEKAPASVPPAADAGE